MDEQALIERILDHVECGEVDKAVIGCLRLARKVNDKFNAIMFLRELYPEKEGLSEPFFYETKGLSDENRDFLWKRTSDHWLEEHRLEITSDSGEKETKYLAQGIGELMRHTDQMRSIIADLDVPAGMTPIDTAAFSDRNSGQKLQARLRIKNNQTIIERVRIRCLDYATRIEHQLDSAQNTQEFISSLQLGVDNYYAERCPVTHKKLLKASSLVSSTDPEDHALLLTSIRRAVRAVADFHFPPSDEPVVCSDGKTRKLGKEEYLNRLQEFCTNCPPPGVSKKLLRAESEFLAVFVRRLHDVASKGVHGEVSHQEAKQGLVGLYMFLSNLIGKLGAEAPDVDKKKAN